MHINTINKALRIVISCIAIWYSHSLLGEVIIPKVICSNMVLQRNCPVIIWGKANKGETVKVVFAGQNSQTITDVNGNWAVTLAPMSASNQPASMEILGTNKIQLENILVGDVWLCSGQSNMEYPMDRTLHKYKAPEKGNDLAAEELSKERPQSIRVMYVEKKRDKNDIVSKGWVSSNDSVLRYISAVGYFFAKEIYETEHVPIGLISSAWGGTRIEEWTPDWAYANSAVFSETYRKSNHEIDGIPPGKKFETMLQYIVPFALKGVLWYQGESNVFIHDMANYPKKFKLLVDTWRSLWKQPDLPFYYVQLAPYSYSRRTKDKLKHTPEILPEMWEAQFNCVQIPHTGMVSTTDLVDEFSNIHPPYKWIVGHRLALCALANTYNHKNTVYFGPTYKKMKIKKNKIFLEFDNVGDGLISKDGKTLSCFSIAGDDGKFVPATAEVFRDNKVIVYSSDVKQPKIARFDWSETASSNFFNKEGFPAFPFRSNKNK